MEDIGVKAVVENTQSFISDMKKLNVSVEGFAETIFDLGTSIGLSQLEELGLGILDVQGALGSLGPVGLAASFALKLLGEDIMRLASDIKTVFVKAFNLAVSTVKFFGKAIKAIFSPARAIIDAFVGSLRRIGEIATGILIANTVRKLSDTISGMATAALDAAINFQTLEVRLQGLAARQIFNQGEVESFGQALGIATGKASELMDWVIKLSLKAPISTDAIANTLTLATSYGLGEEAAKDMTKAVLTFASGMGLTDLAQRRIIENFGQMIQQGKITSMELRDMGRGAFVPVGDLLNKTAELLGITADEFDGTAASLNAFAKEKGLDSVMTMMEAFIQLTETEFEGAIERMGATIQGLRQRFKNLVSSIIGLNILKPALDLLGGSISNIFDKIAESEKIKIFSEKIGSSLRIIVQGLLDSMPTVEEIVEKIEAVMGKITVALRQFREGDIMGGLSSLGVPQSLLDFITKVKNFTTSDKFVFFIGAITTKFKELKDFWNTNKGTIITALRVAAGDIFDALGIKKPSMEDPMENFLKFKEEDGGGIQLQPILDTITTVKDAIITFIETIQLITTTWEENKGVFLLIGAAFLAMRYPILTFMTLLAGLPALIATTVALMLVKITEAEWFQTGADVMADFLNGLISGFSALWTWAVQQAANLADLFNPFGGIGTGGGGGAPTSQSAPSSVPTSQAPTSQNVTNNTINVGPVNQQTQTPVKMSDDIAILLGKIQ